jgi:hypothetical protein
MGGSGRLDCRLRPLALDGLEAAAVELEQLIHVLVGLGSGSAAEAGRGRRGAANAGRGGHKLEQIECDVFIAPRAKVHCG